MIWEICKTFCLMYLYNWIFCKVQAHKKNTPLGSAFPAIIFFCDANYLNHMQHLSNRWYKSDLVSQRSSKKICRSFFVSISESLVQTQLEWQESLFLMLFVCFFPFPLFEVVHKVCAPRKAGTTVTLCESLQWTTLFCTRSPLTSSTTGTVSSNAHDCDIF